MESWMIVRSYAGETDIVDRGLTEEIARHEAGKMDAGASSPQYFATRETDDNVRSYAARSYEFLSRYDREDIEKGLKAIYKLLFELQDRIDLDSSMVVDVLRRCNENADDIVSELAFHFEVPSNG